MEHTELSIYLCNTAELAYQKYGPFICPSELGELVNCLPRLFEAQNLQIGDLGVRVKMPRLTGERHLLIVDLERNTDDEVTVFAMDNLSAEDDSNDILRILKQTIGRDVLSDRALRTISGEEVNEEYCLNGDHTILIVGSVSVTPLQETPLPDDVQSDSNKFKLLSNGESPPINDTNAPTIEAESINRVAQLMSYESLEDMENKSDDQPCKSPQVELQVDLSISEIEGQGEDEPTRDIAEKPGSSSPMAMMPESFRSLFSDDDYESDSMNELQEGQEEATARRIELPTADEIANIIFNDKAAIAKEKIRKAYYESFDFRERGGWIFVNPNNPTQMKIVLAPISASDSFRATDMMTTPSIDLENIVLPDDVPADYILVANFHTHPLFNNEEPSKADVDNAYHRGIPGIVISRTKIFGYGPERRANTDEPHRYAPPIEDNKSVLTRKLKNNPFPLM